MRLIARSSPTAALTGAPARRRGVESDNPALRAVTGDRSDFSGKKSAHNHFNLFGRQITRSQYETSYHVCAAGPEPVLASPVEKLIDDVGDEVGDPECAVAGCGFSNAISHADRCGGSHRHDPSAARHWVNTGIHVRLAP